MRINTNVSSLQAQRAMREHNKQVQDSSGNLSSGVRVRSAADDAASLALGLKKNSQIRSQNQALRNTNDAVSELQVAEGGMNEINDMLVRLKELSIQASNGTLLDEERGLINNEYMALRREIERQARVTEMRGEPLLYSDGSREFMIGTQSNPNSQLTINQEDLLLTEFNMKIVDSNVENAEEARLNLSCIEDALDKVAQNRARVGSLQSRLSSSMNNLEISKINESSSYSRIMDADYAFETAEKLNGERKLATAAAVLSQTKNLGTDVLKLIG